MEPHNWKVMTLSLATFSAITYLLCVAYGLVAPVAWQPAGLLERVLPGFTWLTYPSFVLGLVETLVYGAYAGALYTMLHNTFLGWIAPAKEEPTRFSRAA
jgi:hypothetical protein